MVLGFIGAGRVAMALGRFLTEKFGHRTFFYSRNTASALRCAEACYGGVAMDLEEIAKEADLLFISTGDDAIGEVAKALALVTEETIPVFHFSGSLTSEVLAPLAGKGHPTGSLHPIWSFAGDPIDRLPAMTYEGSQEGFAAIESLLNGQTDQIMHLEAEHKVLYHAACVMLSNDLSALLSSAFGLLCGIGLDKPGAFTPLILGTIENYLRMGDAGLTGPVRRGDRETVAAHLAALPPEQAAIYRLLGEKTLRMSREAGLDEASARDLAALLER
jgi:predicted short-subunit dehydrogenase-like oxidoreductase (DUF2520 family)